MEAKCVAICKQAGYLHRWPPGSGRSSEELRSLFPCGEKFLAVMCVCVWWREAALVNTKHSRRYFINTNHLFLSGTKLRSFIELLYFSVWYHVPKSADGCAVFHKGKERNVSWKQAWETTFAEICLFLDHHTPASPTALVHSGEEINWVNKNIQAGEHALKSQCLQTTDKECFLSPA